MPSAKTNAVQAGVDGLLVLDLPPLVLPHKRLHERAFVLVPLMDIAPDLLHPVLDKTVRQLLADVDTSGIVLHDGQIETTVTPKS